VDLAEEDREDIKLLLIYFCLRHRIYSSLWRAIVWVLVTNSRPRKPRYRQREAT